MGLLPPAIVPGRRRVSRRAERGVTSWLAHPPALSYLPPPGLAWTGSEAAFRDTRPLAGPPEPLRTQRCPIRGGTEPQREGATRLTAWTSVNNQSTRLPFEAAVDQRRPTTNALVNHEFPRLPTAVEHAQNVPLQRLTRESLDYFPIRPKKAASTVDGHRQIRRPPSGPVRKP